MTNFKIEKYFGHNKEELLSVWEKSVLATHHFLSPRDFADIKKSLHELDFTSFDIYCLTGGSGEIAGFIALSGAKIEMLFLLPEYCGQTLGKQLVTFAVSERNATLVDVNEQNLNAFRFYKKTGFETYERTGKDSSGKSYPLLKMRLKPNKIL
ncbi:MAG: GNAT family N-acetyltransferase [Syntrophomonadaceae bacterium]|nr:GNAT family N-acetyltransferase [Syntrophomonadaceae bacterium]